MADTDNSSYIIRYNLTDNNLEYFQGADWYTATATIVAGITQLTGDVTAGPGVGSQVATVSNTAAVKSIHADSSSNLTGAVHLVSGTNVTLSQVGQAITVNASGGSAPTPNIVQFMDTADSATTSSALTATTTAVTITPSSSSAKIKISVNGTGRSTNLTSAGVHIALYRDNTTLLVSPRSAVFYALGGSTTDAAENVAFNYLDTPGDTSPHTYTVYISNDDNSTQVSWFCTAAPAIIIAEEVH